MNHAELLKSVEAPVNENIPELTPGDAVRGGANDASFTVRRIASNGIGVERNFLMRSPRIEKVVVDRHTKARRARLYFLRERKGKSARLKQRF